jgi:amino-acid N-acetyltransferase
LHQGAEDGEAAFLGQSLEGGDDLVRFHNSINMEPLYERQEGVAPCGVARDVVIGESSGMTMTYRSASVADWPAIARLLEACGLTLMGAEAHVGQFIVAEAHGAIVGCVGAEVYGTDALLRSLAVAEAERGRGIGDALEARMIAALKARGVKRVGLLTMTAERFFARRGFKRVARDDLPAALQASEEIKGACCESAAAMMMRI